MRGSIIAAALLTLLPEVLRGVGDYRMLAYAVLLIGIMLVTHNPKIADKIKQIKITYYEKNAAKTKAKMKKTTVQTAKKEDK